MKHIHRAQNIAWQFLKLNPDYQTDCQTNATQAMLLQNEPALTIYKQTHADVSANKWGLFSYQDPSKDNTPFWSISPTLEAQVSSNGEPAFLPFLQEADLHISGILLLGGELILRIENAIHSIQIKIQDGRSFNSHSALTLLYPLTHNFSSQVARGLNLWNMMINQDQKK